MVNESLWSALQTDLQGMAGTMLKASRDAHHQHFVLLLYAFHLMQRTAAGGVWQSRKATAGRGL